MNNTVKILALTLCIQFSAPSYAIDFNFKEVSDFKVLSEFKSINEFEKEYQSYTQDCLDNTYGGAGGIPCFLGSDIWDRNN